MISTFVHYVHYWYHWYHYPSTVLLVFLFKLCLSSTSSRSKKEYPNSPGIKHPSCCIASMKSHKEYNNWPVLSDDVWNPWFAANKGAVQGVPNWDHPLGQTYGKHFTLCLMKISAKSKQAYHALEVLLSSGLVSNKWYWETCSSNQLLSCRILEVLPL